MRFAAFIMTYERAEILSLTIDKILSQSYPPQEVLIVDNSSSNETQKFWEGLGNDLVTYHKMGYNSGPAGAAYYGLKALAEKGYDWIFWGDDDDPPKHSGVFKELLSIAGRTENVGIVGGLGGQFLKNRARTRNFYNKELQGIMDADYVAGGQMMIVNSDVVKEGILPTQKLFFGFEELDFCLKVKEQGYRIVFDGERIKKERIARGDTHPDYKWQGKTFGNKELVWRQYYSIRNMLYILKSRHIYTGYIYYSVRNIFKILASYKYGLNYGTQVLRLYKKAFWHHLNGKYGYQGRNNL
ncbi:glycosyltransferase family 2 protein [Salinimicrobium flavum]|uniref:Glycosyltransferase family 2 protein n=1 Tax=Salinimicrobium flavum TaxID=1737065 RepID=A0ABW5J0A4_9FLAO